ncbi:hypothetical protein SDRG_01986 [Saprolegnia diclina VS20]|uniref:MARVEL domain-containing protein n=1 Tax=Saprolegnia diclina (strain VS20) TaxID=1156394 RepID=T0R1T2_SAPDV|nr:hypothetical protein SDRG_01986 [Saprolegnia diclina VS20]EQC40921.1 hypothetical protein SDRG_01986 [Saprolegnia diclina VS20]|eukprot:XP_008605765.1 hypothetical protein SDRG_01986 [Saprolegnia diclina VS20]
MELPLEVAVMRKRLNLLLLVNGAIAVLTTIATLFELARTGGITSLLTSATYILYTFSAIFMLNNNPSAFTIGMLIGSSGLVVILAFEHMLYWTISSCRHGYAADIFLSLFHCIFFLLSALFSFTVFKHRHVLIDTSAVYYDTIPEGMTPRSPGALDYDEEDARGRLSSNASSYDSHGSLPSPSVPTADI